MLVPVFAAVVFTRILSALAFSASASNNIAVYWGQNSGGGQQPLATYCAREEVDIVILSFLYGFPKMMLNFANACENTFTSEGLLHCSNIAEDIKTCQQNGKKVLLSLGGATGVYGFTSDSEATDFADTLWNYFGAGHSGVERPFDDAIVDGFDFDIENQNQVGYPALANALRQKFAEDSSKQYYLAAAPQCPYPDASVGNVLAQSDIDFAFIQFYNNYCSLGPNFNWDTWTDYAANVSPNKNIKLYVGLPGEARSAGTGYHSAADVQAQLPSSVLSSPYFGGFSFWDASSAIANVDSSGQNMCQALKSFASNSGGSSPQPSPSSKLTTTSSSTSATENPWQQPPTSSTSTTIATTTSSSTTANPWQPTTSSSTTVTSSSSSSSEDLLGEHKEILLSSGSTDVSSSSEATEATDPTTTTSETTEDPTTSQTTTTSSTIVSSSTTETSEPVIEPSSTTEPTTVESQSTTVPTSSSSSSSTLVVSPESIAVVDPTTAVPESTAAVPESTEAVPSSATTAEQEQQEEEEVYEPTTLKTSSIKVVDAFPTSSVVTTTETQADGRVVVVTKTEGHTVTEVVTEAALQTTRVKVMTVKKGTTAFNTKTTTAMTTRYITTLYRH